MSYQEPDQATIEAGSAAEVGLNPSHKGTDDSLQLREGDAGSACIAFSLSTKCTMAFNVAAENTYGIVVNGASAGYGILLNGGVYPGNVGMFVDQGYSVPLAVASDRPVKFDGPGGNNFIYHTVGGDALVFHSEKLAVQNHSVVGTATAGAGGMTPPTVAGFLSIFVNGVEQRVPYYSV